MLWLIDSCQNKVSADQYYVTISQPQVYELMKVNFFQRGADHLSGTGRQLDCRLKPGYVISMRSSALIRLSLIYTLVFYFVKTILQNLAHGIHIVHNSSIVPRHARGSILPEQLGLMMMMHGCHCSLAFARVFS